MCSRGKGLGDDAINDIELAEIGPRYDVCKTNEKIHSKATAVVTITVSDYVPNPIHLVNLTRSPSAAPTIAPNPPSF